MNNNIPKILLIKIGALGDVVRTTSLLHALNGEVTWVTQRGAFSLLEGNPLIARVCDIDHAPTLLKDDRYDLIINLDEEPQACALASSLSKNELVGAYQNGSKLAYTDSSQTWFDMGLISRFGKKEADIRKWHNRKSYQEIIYTMIGKKFKGEEYILPALAKNRDPKKETIGIEDRSGDRWMGKRWSRFPEFLRLLEHHKLNYVKFHAFPTLREFMEYINQTDLVVTTDSLALHIALGLRKKVISLFTCTSFHEIHDYQRMTKIISPLIEKYYYSTDSNLDSGKSIEPEVVLKELLKLKEIV